MIKTINNVHHQFAHFFDEPKVYDALSLLSEKMSEGHVCIDIDEDSKSFHSKFRNKNLLSINGQNYTPFVLHKQKFYLQRYYKYETNLLNKILAMMQVEAEKKEQRKEEIRSQKKLIENLFEPIERGKEDWQLVAAITALMNNFTIITGGPGTGKTTTVAKILSIIFAVDPKTKIALAAPTGKAAARLSESLANTKINVPKEIEEMLKSIDPYTIHRLLGWQKDSPYFVHNEEKKLELDVLIIDESSMIDLALFSKLLAAIDVNTRIIFLGDKNQLASVEAGSLFGDLCSIDNRINTMTLSQKTFIEEFTKQNFWEIDEKYLAENDAGIMFQHIVTLQKSYRFDDEKGIGKLSAAILNNKQEVIKNIIESKTGQNVFIDLNYDETVFKTFLDGYKDVFINEENDIEKSILKSLKALNKIKVLCAVRQGEHGLYELNKRIERHFVAQNWITIDNEFYENRAIMVTQNNYDLGLFNGDIGILRKDKNGITRAWFIDNKGDDNIELKSVLPGFIAQLETVFAMTIHKSQGSEFEEVMIILPKENRKEILSRELLYTAITRAKSKAWIQANETTIFDCAATQVARSSGVEKRLAAYNPNEENFKF